MIETRTQASVVASKELPTTLSPHKYTVNIKLTVSIEHEKQVKKVNRLGFLVRIELE